MGRIAPFVVCILHPIIIKTIDNSNDPPPAVATERNDQPIPTSVPNNARKVDKSPNVPWKKYR
jgi:hypothetical protein